MSTTLAPVPALRKEGNQPPSLHLYVVDGREKTLCGARLDEVEWGGLDPCVVCADLALAQFGFRW